MNKRKISMPELRKFETILLENKLVTAEQLSQADSYAHAVGIDLHEAVIQKKISAPDAVMMAYAESIGLPFVHLAEISVDESTVVQVNPITARQHSFVPISIDQGHLLLATTHPVVPDVEEELRMIFNVPIRCVICTPTELNAAIAKFYPRGAVRIDAERKEQADQKLVSSSKEQREEESEPMNEEELKNRFLYTMTTFCFSLGITSFVMNLTQVPKGLYNTFYFIPTILLAGIVVGSIVGAVVWRIFSR